MNKKLLTMAIALLACSSLIIGCQSKKEEKPSSNIEPQSSESVEPELEPEPEPEPEPAPLLDIPHNVDEARFLTFDQGMSYDAASFDLMVSLYQIPGRGMNSDPEKIGLKGFREYSGKDNFDFQKNEITRQEGVWAMTSYIGDQYYEISNEYNYRIIPDVLKYLEGYDCYAYIGLAGENDDHYYFTQNNYSSSRFPYVSISSDSAGYFAESAKREFNKSFNIQMDPNNMLQGLLNDDNYIIANMYGFERSQIAGTNSVDEPYSYVLEEEEQIILIFDQDTKPIFYYHYSEVRADHNLFTGAPLDEFAIMMRNMESVEFVYGEIEDIADQDYPITALPENYLVDGGLEFQYVPAEVDEEGYLTAKPEFGNEYKSGDFAYESLTEGRIDCINNISSESGYMALDIGNIFLKYANPVTDEVTDINFPLNNTEVFDEIVEQIGGQRLAFDDEEYIIVEINNSFPSGFSLTFPTIDEVNPSNIKVGDFTLYYLM